MKNVIILGSGRSGTSMVAGALANPGYFMGEEPDYLKKSKANSKGFFEDLEVNTINEDLLKNLCYNWPESIRKTFFPSHTFYRARWLARISDPVFSIDPSIDARIKKVILNKPFCIKDPRFSYTLPVWQKHIGKDVIILVVYRHPIYTARSIITQCQESPALRKLKMNRKIALKVWENMYRNILKNYESRGENNWYFVHYEQMFLEENVLKIEKYLQTSINRSFMNRNLSRSKDLSEETLSDSIAKTYHRLNKLSNYIPH